MKSLVVRFGGEIVGSHEIRPGTYTFGRRGGVGPEPDLHFATSEDFISDQHCHFIVEPDYVEVVDGWPGGRTRSTYGVHVNGICRTVTRTKTASNTSELVDSSYFPIIN